MEYDLPALIPTRFPGSIDPNTSARPPTNSRMTLAKPHIHPGIPDPHQTRLLVTPLGHLQAL